MNVLSSADFFQNHFFENTIRVSKGLDPDYVGPNLGPNCLQMV